MRDREDGSTNGTRHQHMKESVSMGQIQATGNHPDSAPLKFAGGLNSANKGSFSKQFTPN